MKKMILLLGVMLSCVAFAGYEQDVLKKMTPIEERIEEENYGLGSSNASMFINLQKLRGLWKSEMEKVYKVYSSKLSQSEKVKLDKEQKNVEVKVKNFEKEVKEDFGGGNGVGIATEEGVIEIYKKRTLELAKRYDKLNKK